MLTDKFTAAKYEAIVEFRNAYGELPATQIPKLPFYGGITLLYFFVAVYWGFLYYQYHSDIRMLFLRLSRDDIRETDIRYSGGSELHNSDSHLPRCRNVDDLGFLRYAFPVHCVKNKY